MQLFYLIVSLCFGRNSDWELRNRHVPPKSSPNCTTTPSTRSVTWVISTYLFLPIAAPFIKFSTHFAADESPVFGQWHRCLEWQRNDRQRQHSKVFSRVAINRALYRHTGRTAGQRWRHTEPENAVGNGFGHVSAARQSSKAIPADVHDHSRRRQMENRQRLLPHPGRSQHSWQKQEITIRFGLMHLYWITFEWIHVTWTVPYIRIFSFLNASIQNLQVMNVPHGSDYRLGGKDCW